MDNPRLVYSTETGKIRPLCVSEWEYGDGHEYMHFFSIVRHKYIKTWQSPSPRSRGQQ